MKILQVNPLFVSGGAEKLALTFHRAYLERGLESRLISLTGVSPPHLPHSASLGLPSPWHPAAVLRLRRLFRDDGEWLGRRDIELLSKVVYGLIMRRRDPGVLHLRI